MEVRVRFSGRAQETSNSRVASRRLHQSNRQRQQQQERWWRQRQSNGAADSSCRTTSGCDSGQAGAPRPRHLQQQSSPSRWSARMSCGRTLSIAAVPAICVLLNPCNGAVAAAADATVISFRCPFIAASYQHHQHYHHHAYVRTTDATSSHTTKHTSKTSVMTLEMKPMLDDKLPSRSPMQATTLAMVMMPHMAVLHLVGNGVPCVREEGGWAGRADTDACTHTCTHVERTDVQGMYVRLSRNKCHTPEHQCPKKPPQPPVSV